MGVQKAIQFAAPYRSSTFNSGPQSLLTGLNGVVTGGLVTTSGGIATVQPLTFVQNGLLVTTDDAISAAIPSGLTAPYFIAVTTSSSIYSPTEVITPTFVKRPQDVSGNTCLVASWDGYEWQALPNIQIGGQIQAAQVRAVTQQFSGIANGFDAEVSGGDIDFTAGALIDRQGALVTKESAASLPISASDADGLERIDEIFFRRPDDSPARAGHIEYIVGETVDPDDGVSFYHSTQIGNALLSNTASKILNVPSNNLSIFLFLQDVGARASLIFRSSPNALTTVSAAVAIATNLSSFDALVSPDGFVDIVYVRGNTLYYQRVTTAGVSVYAETAIAVDTVSLLNPRIASINSGTSYFLHTVYERVVSGSVHQLWYVRLSNVNTIETSPSLFVDISSLVTHATVDKDDDDSLLFIAYENSSTGRVYLRTYDAATPTGMNPPIQLGGTLELEDDTFILSADTTAPAGGSSYPVVKRTDNKDTLVFWLQSKDGTNTGVAVYSPRFLNLYGHKAVIQDLTAVHENITAFAAAIDGLSTAHFGILIGSYLIKASLRVDTMTVLGTPGTVVTPISPAGFNIAFTSLGALIHTYAPQSIGFQANDSPLTIQYFGAGNFMGTQPIAANEFVLTQAAYNTLPYTPALGDLIMVGSAGVNNGNYNWLGVRSFTISAVNYVAVATSVAAFSNAVGSGMAQFEIPNGTTTTFVKSTAGITSNLRSFYSTPTDVYMAHYRSSDGFLAVAGTSIEEDVTIRRLYEFFSAFAGATGVISWQVAAANTLVFESEIQFSFFNRVSLYTIPANSPSGLVVGNNQVAMVTIPDLDADADLTVEVIDFGAGVLDRYGKNTFPLFWNVGGSLYMKFAPFRLEASGESTYLGSQISSQFMEWLGITSPAPDPTDHGYTSLNLILQGDTPPAAISKLDAAVEAIITNMAVEDTIDITNPLGQTVVASGILNWSPSNAVQDIQVCVNGRHQTLDTTGLGNEDYIKLSATELEFSYTLPEDARVSIREERTGGTIGNSGIGAMEDIVDVTNPLGITTYTSPGILWNPLSSVPDIQVFVNSRKQTLDPAGGSNYDFYKISSSEIGFSYTVPFDARIVLRKDPIGNGGAGGSTDLTNIAVNIQPQVDGLYAVGTSVKAWKALYLKDQSSGENFEVTINDGEFTLTPL